MKKLVSEYVDANNVKTERKDFFSFAGQYLGFVGELSDFIWEYRNSSLLFKGTQIKDYDRYKILKTIEVNKYPSLAEFKVEETKRQILQATAFHPSFTVDDGFPSERDLGLVQNLPADEEYTVKTDPLLDTEEFKEQYGARPMSIENFEFTNGYHPQDMPNVIYYGNLAEYMARAKSGDVFALKYVCDLFENPLSFVHSTKYAEVKKDFFESINSMLFLSTIHPWENILEKTVPAVDQNFYCPLASDQPYIAAHNILLGNLKLEVLLLCTFYIIDENDIGDAYRNNCYAMRLKFTPDAVAESLNLYGRYGLYKVEAANPPRQMEYYVWEVGIPSLEYIKGKNDSLLKLNDNAWFIDNEFNFDITSINEKLMGLVDKSKDIPNAFSHERQYHFLHKLPSWENIISQQESNHGTM